MRRPSGIVLVLLLTVLTVWPPPAWSADAGLALACMQLLRDNHVTAPEAAKLLRAATDGIRNALARAVVPGFQGDLAATADDAARQQFQARFDQAVALAQGKVPPLQLQYGACESMAASMDDSHTWFSTPEQLAESQRPGIGVRLTTASGRFYVMEVFPNSPAAGAGLQPFDRIMTIDGQSTEGMSVEALVSRLRGGQGTAVRLTVWRPGQADSQTVSVTRAALDVPSVQQRMLEGSVGYIRMQRFVRGSSAGLFRRAVEELKRGGMRALVVDVRSNPGGSSRDGTEIASALLPPGLPVETHVDRRGRKTTIPTEGTPLIDAAVRVVLITDGATASQAELLSAAIREHRRGVLVGTKTSGRLGWNERYSLPAGAMMSVTTMLLTTGRGAVVEKNGLVPDIQVELTVDDLDQGRDTQLQRALQAARP